MEFHMDFDFRPGEGLPFAAHERIRARGEVFWSDTLCGWIVSSHSGVKTVLGDSETYASEGSPLAEAFSPQAMLVTDSPLHHTIRNVWAKAASIPGAKARGGAFREIVDRLIYPVAARLNAGETVELVGVFEDFTAEVITLLMGLSREYRRNFQKWNRAISDAAALALSKDDPRYVQRDEARKEVYEFLHGEVLKRQERFAKGEPPDDLIGMMVAAEGYEGITESIALDNLLNLFLGALDTTVKWLGNIVTVLHRYPRVWAEVKADRSLLPQAIEEVMRLETVVQVTTRLVRRNGVELAGQMLKASDVVYVLPGVANRDPAVVERPEVFDIRRGYKPHLGFGFGMHHCLGVNIARMEVLCFIERCFDILPKFKIVECDYGTSWSIWGPVSLQLRANDTGMSDEVRRFAGP
jgi:cytochrome P450